MCETPNPWAYLAKTSWISHWRNYARWTEIKTKRQLGDSKNDGNLFPDMKKESMFIENRILVSVCMFNGSYFLQVTFFVWIQHIEDLNALPLDFSLPNVINSITIYCFKFFYSTLSMIICHGLSSKDITTPSTNSTAACRQDRDDSAKIRLLDRLPCLVEMRKL